MGAEVVDKGGPEKVGGGVEVLIGRGVGMEIGGEGIGEKVTSGGEGRGVDLIGPAKLKGFGSDFFGIASAGFEADTNEKGVAAGAAIGLLKIIGAGAEKLGIGLDVEANEKAGFDTKGATTDAGVENEGVELANEKGEGVTFLTSGSDGIAAFESGELNFGAEELKPKKAGLEGTSDSALTGGMNDKEGTGVGMTGAGVDFDAPNILVEAKGEVEEAEGGAALKEKEAGVDESGEGIEGAATGDVAGDGESRSSSDPLEVSPTSLSSPSPSVTDPSSPSSSSCSASSSRL